MSPDKTAYGVFTVAMSGVCVLRNQSERPHEVSILPDSRSLGNHPFLKLETGNLKLGLRRLVKECVGVGVGKSVWGRPFGGIGELVVR